MTNDPIINEIRETRKNIEKKCNNDAQKYFEHILEVQKKYQGQLVRRKPKPALQYPKASQDAATNQSLIWFQL